VSDSNPQSEGLDDDQVLTKLIQSNEVATPSLSSWQLSNFDSKEADEKSELSERITDEVQKQIEPELKKQSELLKKEAFDSAYKEGYAAGFTAGSDEGKLEAIESETLAQKAAFEPKLEQLAKLVTVLENPYLNIQEQVLSELVDLSLHVAQKVTNIAISEHKDWLLETIKETVLLLPDDSAPYHVELHPEDIALLASLPSTLSNEIKPNLSLMPGTCLVQQGHSSILNNWQARFDELANDLKSKTATSNTL